MTTEKTISIGELRQNPTAALDDVERGGEFLVTRHNKGIARLVPAQPRRRPVTNESAQRFFAETRQLVDQEWEREIREARDALTADDPWEQGP